jgi:hypothetical protein
MESDGLLKVEFDFVGGSLWQYVCNQAIVAEMVVFYKKIITLHKNNELH